jgi:hypothetical protein
VGLVDLFLAVLVVGISAVNAAPPAVAWSRERDGRFLAIAAANLVLAVVGALGVWGQLPVSPPSWTSVGLPILGLLLLVALLFLATSLLPRRT